MTKRLRLNSNETSLITGMITWPYTYTPIDVTNKGLTMFSNSKN